METLDIAKTEQERVALYNKALAAKSKYVNLLMYNVQFSLSK